MNDMEFEMQNLTRDLDTAKNQVVSLERNLDLRELERLKLDEKLQRSQRKCEELEETVTRLLEEKKVSDDREKRAEERCEKISAENSKMSYEFHNLISELNETIKELKDKNLENERSAGERYKRLDTMVTKMGQEIEDLRLEKLGTVETVEELRRENFEAKKTIGELRLKNSESEKVADVYKRRLENLSPRMKKIEENLADMLTMNVGDLANLANNLRELATNSKVFSDSKGKDDDSSGKGAENGVIMSTPKSEKGDRNSDQPWARGEDDEAHNTVKTSCGSQSGCNSLKPENNGCKKPLGSGAHASGTRLMSGEGCFRKITHSSSVATDIVEIMDSDDEANPDGAANVSNVGENKINFVRSPSSSQRSKRNRTEDLFANSTTERKRNMHTSDEEKWGCTLAEYLVDGDKELKQSVSEVKKTASWCHHSMQKAR